MEYVISKDIIPIKYQKVYGITPNTKYKVLAIVDASYPFFKIYPEINPIEYKFYVEFINDIGNITILENINFKSTRELNLEKILNK